MNRRHFIGLLCAPAIVMVASLDALPVGVPLEALHYDVPQFTVEDGKVRVFEWARFYQDSSTGRFIHESSWVFDDLGR